MSSYQVAIVVDRTYGDRLLELAHRSAVWIVDSPINRVQVQQVWDAAKSAPRGHGVTLFNAYELEEPEEMCERILTDVNEHHGGAGHQESWSVAEVIGTSLTDRVEKAFRELEFAKFVSTDTGFRCLREAPGEP